MVAVLSGMGLRQRTGPGVARLLGAEAVYAGRRILRPGPRAASGAGPGGAGRAGAGAVAAVIPYFRSDRVIVAAIEALAGQTHPPESVTVVADSPMPAEIEGALESLGARVLTPGTNVGFARACNLAAATAGAGGADFLFFVNPDLACDPDRLETLLGNAGPARRSPRLAAPRRHPGTVDQERPVPTPVGPVGP